MKYLAFFACLSAFVACNSQSGTETKNTMPEYQTVGTIEKYDDALDAILDVKAKPEIIAEGFDWSEGPLWLEKQDMLIFSDVPANTIYKWSAAKGKEVYLTPSGYTDTVQRKGEVGSNGLTLDPEGNLAMCQHGDRRVARMNAPLDNPKPDFITLAGSYEGKRLSSPNDAVFSSAGDLYFTDPPYGLESQNDNDPKKEIPFNGVYKVKPDGQIILLVDSISRPNGIAFFPGEQKILIASSDPVKPNWYIYDVSGDELTNGKVFYSAADHERGVKGLPDGLKIDHNGNVFATGPGGLYIFNSEGKKLGMVKFPEATSNCAFSPDQKTIYITNDMNILRLKLRN